MRKLTLVVLTIILSVVSITVFACEGEFQPTTSTEVGVTQARIISSTDGIKVRVGSIDGDVIPIWVLSKDSNEYFFFGQWFKGFTHGLMQKGVKYLRVTIIN